MIPFLAPVAAKLTAGGVVAIIKALVPLVKAATPAIVAMAASKSCGKDSKNKGTRK